VSTGYRLSIVLPAYNEAGNIAEALRRCTAAADRLCREHEIIVVDDGSGDDTADLVRRAAAADSRIRLVQHPRNLGYGEALRSGFRAGTMDLVFFTDSDNQFDLEELEQFLPWIDKVDVVAGFRINRQDKWTRRLSAHTWNLLVRGLFYVPVRDIDCAFKLFRRHLLESLDLESVGAMVNTELMVKLGRSGAGVVEIGVTHYPRTSGQARGAHPKVIWRALVELTRLSRRLRQTSAGGVDAPAAPALPSPPAAPRPAPSAQRVVVIGGGIAGCAAALRMAQDGQTVTLVERSAHLGGLVVSFSIGGTPLECFYHHIFPHEHDIIALIGALGLGDRLEWHDSSTGVLCDSRIWPFTSPVDLVRFTPLPLRDRIRAGVGALRMRRVMEWRPLDEVSAASWLRSYCGPGASRVLWDPLLKAKFGPAAGDVPAAWMWGRVHQRNAARKGMGEKLGYLRGGFKQLFDALDGELRRLGVEVLTDTQVERIAVTDGRISGVETSSGSLPADAVVYAGTLNGLPRLLDPSHHDPRWGAIGALGVLCVVLELRRSVSGIYWTNVCDEALPFGGIIEHTNLLPIEDYGGRHVVYLSRYFTADEAVASADPREEAERWVDELVAHVDGLSRDDVVAIHPFKTPYAAPLISLGHLKRLSPIEGPVDGLYVATTAQIYPQDRGMDEGVKAGYRTADVLGGVATVLSPL
jgi:protoporphyrinogen oxidase